MVTGRPADKQGPTAFVTVRTISTDMAGRTHDDPDEDGVEFIHEDDGSITARETETGVASFGDTRAEALATLAEALVRHEGVDSPGFRLHRFKISVLSRRRLAN